MTNTIYFDLKPSFTGGPNPYTMTVFFHQHIRVTTFRDPSRTYEGYGIEERNTGLAYRETGISLLPILFACEINIKFNSTFFFDENIQIICFEMNI